MKKDKSLKKKGFTLLELIVAIPIMLMVIALVFSIGIFGNKNFKKTNIQMNNQQAVRLVGDYIKKDVRSAKVLSSVENIVKAQTNSNYYALKYTGNHLVKQKLKKNSDGTVTSVSQTTIGDTLTDLSFLTVMDKGTLKYIVTNNANGQNYSVTYEVILDNIETTVLPSTSVTTIYYANN